MALQVVHFSTDGFSAGVAVRSRVQFNVSGISAEEGDDCRKGVPPKRKNGIGSTSPGPVRRAEPVGCVPERLHLFPREEGCRGRHGEAAILTPSSKLRSLSIFFLVIFIAFRLFKESGSSLSLRISSTALR